MFNEVALWNDIGYHTTDGKLDPGETVTVSRSDDTSPRFLEEHTGIDDLIRFKVFADQDSQAEWVARQIEHNLREVVFVDDFDAEQIEALRTILDRRV